MKKITLTELKQLIKNEVKQVLIESDNKMTTDLMIKKLLSNKDFIEDYSFNCNVKPEEITEKFLKKNNSPSDIKLHYLEFF
jgi:hypothetical protein